MTAEDRTPDQSLLLYHAGALPEAERRALGFLALGAALGWGARGLFTPAGPDPAAAAGGPKLGEMLCRETVWVRCADEADLHQVPRPEQGERLPVGWRPRAVSFAIYGAMDCLSPSASRDDKAPARRDGQALALRLRRAPGVNEPSS
jgi:hypothetical protein